jgi:hypothetical protein
MRQALNFRKRREGVTIPTIWVAFALSLLLHIAVMWQWLPKIHLPSLEEDKLGEKRGSLVVQLAPPPRPPSPPLPPPALPAPPAPAIRAAPPPRPPPAAPVIAMKTPPATPAPTVPAPTVATPAPPRPPADDLASYIEARRRARGESAVAAAPPAPASVANAPAAEDDKARSNRIAAANLATQRQTFGYDPRQGGGVFQIMRMGYTNAEFMFFGWNKDIRRNTKQLIEVQKGNNADTRIAVVRKMISIIREYEQEDFLWESQRLGRNLMLSARARDNAGLEEFMLREFFADPNRPW